LAIAGVGFVKMGGIWDCRGGKKCEKMRKNEKNLEKSAKKCEKVRKNAKNLEKVRKMCAKLRKIGRFW
jgi:hypothetical protein